MNENELSIKLRSLDKQVQELKEKRKELAWTEGVPAIISKMKQFGRDKLYIREMEYEGYFCTEALWFWYGDGRFAAKLLKLEDDKLIVVYNTLSNQEDSYESNWDYDDDDMEAEVDENIAKELISALLPEILNDDYINFEGDDESTSLYGVIDNKGKMVVEPQFDGIWTFSDGLAKIEVDGKYGFIDRNGNIVIEPQYDVAEDFSEGLAMIEVDGKQGFIDKNGNMVVEPQFDNVRAFHDGLARVSVNNEWGFIDKSGNMVVEPQFDYASHFHEGLAWVEVNGKQGLIDRNGNMVIEPQFDNIGSFSEGLAWVEVNGKLGFIDKSGNMVVEPQFDYASHFHEGLAIVTLYVRE